MPFFGNRKIIHLKIRNKREKFYYKGGKRTFGNNQEQALTAKVTLKTFIGVSHCTKNHKSPLDACGNGLFL